MWTLNHAIHKGTLTSRDIAMPETFNTRKEAVKAYTKHKSFYRSIGYMIWYAKITSPIGEKETLEQNPYPG